MTTIEVHDEKIDVTHLKWSHEQFSNNLFLEGTVLPSDVKRLFGLYIFTEVVTIKIFDIEFKLDRLFELYVDMESGRFSCRILIHDLDS